ncbi:MAG: peptidylprolyl isomerase [Eggerthellaceae bacterium]|jgi:foldase protein PrsA
MKKSVLLRSAGATALVCACALALCGCSAFGGGSVAATVNGNNIYEDQVTDAIASLRDKAQLTDDDAWGQYLAQMGMTPEDIRSQEIDLLVQDELTREGAAEKGITVDSSEVDESVNKVRDQYNTEDEYKNALEQSGFTEESYRKDVETKLLKQKLAENLAGDVEPSEDEMVEVLNTYRDTFDGAKRSSHILFNANDEDKAEQVLSDINQGKISFEDAAKKYSTDSATAENGGDVGWDKLSSFVEEYTDALSKLSKGEVSGLVNSSYGIHIIKCTDEYNAPETYTSTDGVPSEILDAVKQVLTAQKQSEAFQSWYDDYKKNADIQINDMPDGLPYAVDMSKYQSSDSGDSSSSDSSSDSSSGDTSSGESSGDSSGGSDSSSSGDSSQ